MAKKRGNIIKVGVKWNDDIFKVYVLWGRKETHVGGRQFVKMKWIDEYSKVSPSRFTIKYI